MCSGCSGDYAGEFDDAGEPAADWEKPNALAGNCGESDGQESQRKPDKTRAFEAESPLPEDWRSAIAPGPKDESAAGVCEILVSETRIIEIRMIAANDCELKELAGAGVGEMPPALQHSTTASAKYYQTRQAGAENRSNRAGMPCYRGIFGFVAVEFSNWTQWARKAFATPRARSSR